MIILLQVNKLYKKIKYIRESFNIKKVVYFIFFINLFNHNLIGSLNLTKEESKKIEIEFYFNKLNNLLNGYDKNKYYPWDGFSKYKFASNNLNIIFKEIIEKDLLFYLGKYIVIKALEYLDTDIVYHFVNNNIEIDKFNKDFNISLFWSYRPDEIFWLKHEHGPEFYNNWIATPLHWAAGQGDIKAVKYFIKYGIPAFVLDCEGNTPADWALVSVNKNNWIIFSLIKSDFIKYFNYYSHLFGVKSLSFFKNIFSKKRDVKIKEEDLLEY